MTIFHTSARTALVTDLEPSYTDRICQRRRIRVTSHMLSKSKGLGDASSRIPEFKKWFRSNRILIRTKRGRGKVKDTRKIIIIVSILMLINGCYARMQQTLRDDRLKPINFNNDEKIAVMLTDDGSHTFVYGVSDDKANMTSQTEKTEFYLGSGIIVATKVQAALLGLFSQVEKFNTKNKEKAILLCKQQNVKFLVVPTILHWEDRNSPWSGIADKIEVKIELFDMTLDKMVNSIIFKANTEWATLTDKPPEDLLNGEFNKAIVDMFGSVK